MSCKFFAKIWAFEKQQPPLLVFWICFIQGRTSPISSGRDSRGFTSLFWGCIFFEFTHAISQLERFVVFFFSHLSSLLCLSVVLQVLFCCNKSLSSPLSSVASGIQNMPDPYQHSKSGKTETNPTGKPSKARILNTYSTHPFTSQRRSCKLGVFSWSHHAILAWSKGYCQWNVMAFSYPLQCNCSWLCACLGYCHFLTSFCSSRKGFLDHKLLLSQCLCGGTRSGASYSTILLTSLQILEWCQHFFELWDLWWSDKNWNFPLGKEYIYIKYKIQILGELYVYSSVLFMNSDFKILI